MALSNQWEALVSTWKQIKIECICFKQKGDTSTLSGKPLNLVAQFTYFGSNISSTENYVNISSTEGMEWYWLVIDYKEI